MMACHALRMILAAIDGLGIDYVTLYRLDGDRRVASVVFVTDEEAGHVAAAMGAELRRVEDSRKFWSTVDVALGDLRITISGPMHDRTPKLEAVP